MRTSSMKSRTAAVTTLVITLILAVPRVDAKPVQPRQGKTRGVITAVTQMIQRYFGITSTALPGEPWPLKPTDPETTTSPFAPKNTVRP